MNYITLTPDVFFDDKNIPSLEYLSHYCQLPTTKKFGYDGYIFGGHHHDLIFGNIAKATYIETWDIANQFPDLEEANTIHYEVRGIPDIGNLKSADNFYVSFSRIFDKEKRYPIFNDYIKVIDDKTLIINGKELIVNKVCSFGPAFYYSRQSQEWKYDNITIEFYKNRIK